MSRLVWNLTVITSVLDAAAPKSRVPVGITGLISEGISNWQELLALLKVGESSEETPNSLTVSH